MLPLLPSMPLMSTPTVASATAARTPGVRIRYMGNKRALADDVAAVCRTLEPGARLIDLFGGLCNVAGAVAADGRSVQVNDIQRYATLAASCLVATEQGPPDVAAASAMLRPAFATNRSLLCQRFDAALRAEAEALATGRAESIAAAAAVWPHAASSAEVAAEVAELRRSPKGPHRLCTLTFSHGYFGLEQSIELDSLRCAIDHATADGATGAAAANARWLRLALLQTASRVASTPGHFAQYLRPVSAAATRRIVACRRRAVWLWFLDDLARLGPYGTARWRRGNRVSGEDALCVVERLAARAAPRIFYADPPYSKEHYSRFYHVLESLERYDYPPAVGTGRYRPDRFHSDFAVGSRVIEAMRRLLSGIAAASGTLLISYPSTGLLAARGVGLGDLLAEHFGEVRLAVDRSASHSTLGGRHGRSSRPVREQLWLAR